MFSTQQTTETPSKSQPVAPPAAAASIAAGLDAYAVEKMINEKLSLLKSSIDLELNTQVPCNLVVSELGLLSFAVAT